MTEISKLPTELILHSWRFGQTQAERLCAELLILEGFTAIDPQCPLGGPDGLKDIVCKMGGLKYVAAAFFPTTPNTSADIKRKFEHDLMGVKRNDASGKVFFLLTSDYLPESVKPYKNSPRTQDSSVSSTTWNGFVPCWMRHVDMDYASSSFKLQCRKKSN
jgi:hypothetical protein